MPRISQLTALSTVTSDDLFVVLNDPSGSPSTRTIAAQSLLQFVESGLGVTEVSSGGTGATSAAAARINLQMPYTFGTGGTSVVAWQGGNNVASGDYSIVGGGNDNSSVGNFSVVGGGKYSTASSDYSCIVGGFGNEASGISSFVGGGGYFKGSSMYGNVASGFCSGVVCGQSNAANQSYSFVGGGKFNSASAMHCTVCGGSENTAGGNYSTIGGGRKNTADYACATIGGGWYNTAGGEKSFVGGGHQNTASGSYGVVGGGIQNIATGNGSFVGGGRHPMGVQNNTAGGNYSFVGSGVSNTASAAYSLIVGGIGNSASARYSSIGGGGNNTASGEKSFVGGGQGNKATGIFSFVGGGGSGTFDFSIAGFAGNTAGGNYSFVGGGKSNTASGTYATIPGGKSNTATHSNVFLLGSNLVSDAADTTYVENLKVKNNLTLSSPLGVASGGTGATNTTALASSLGFGSLANQNQNNVTITGGTISIDGLFNVGMVLSTDSFSTAKMTARSPIKNFKEVGEVPIFTVPSGYMFLVDTMEVVTTSISGADIPPKVRFGTTATADLFHASARTTSNSFGERHVVENRQNGVDSGSVVSFGVTEASTASTHYGAGVVTGYLLKKT